MEPKSKWILGWGLAVLVLFNHGVWKKERLLRSGRTVLLELAPVDPRSLMQGDYMILDYALLRQFEKPKQAARLVLVNDERGIAQFEKIDDGSALPDEGFFIKFKPGRRNGSLGAESFFFQEGQASHYENAKYGELVVDKKGNSVLVGLRDADLNPLGSKKEQETSP